MLTIPQLDNDLEDVPSRRQRALRRVRTMKRSAQRGFRSAKGVLNRMFKKAAGQS